MAFMRLAFFPGGTTEQWAAVVGAVGDVSSPEGRRAFAAGPVEDGAAIGAGIGAGLFTQQDAFSNRKAIARVKPQQQALYNGLYEKWLGVQEDNNRQ